MYSLPSLLNKDNGYTDQAPPPPIPSPQAEVTVLNWAFRIPMHLLIL